MAKDFSFDIVSDFDLQEVKNAVDQTKRDIETRYDFKGQKAEVELGKEEIMLSAESEQRAEAILELLQQKFSKRGLSLLILDPQKIEQASGGTVRQTIKLRKGIDQEQAKKLNKQIRDAFPKAKPTIQGPAIRVVASSKDDLQGIMALLKGDPSIQISLQFENYR